MQYSSLTVGAMIDALSTAASGIRNEAAQFDKAAQRVVKAAAPSGGDDLAAAIVDAKVSEIGFSANVAVFKTADKMLGALLDTVA
jgi:hypothetical protein